MQKNSWWFNVLCCAGFATIIILLLMIFLSGCSLQICEEKQDAENANQKLLGDKYIVPVNLGQGVYLFDCECNQKWQKSLVKFIENNPDLRITAIYAASERLNGFTSQIIVVTEKRCNCDCCKNK